MSAFGSSSCGSTAVATRTLPELLNEFFKQFLVGNYYQSVEVGECIELAIEEHELRLDEFPMNSLRSYVTDMCYPFYIAYVASLFAVVATDTFESKESVDNVNSLKYLLKRIQEDVENVQNALSSTLGQQVTLLLVSDNLFRDLQTAMRNYWRGDYVSVMNIIDQLASVSGPCNFADARGGLNASNPNPKQIISQSLMIVQKFIRYVQYASISRLYTVISVAEISKMVCLPMDKVMQDCEHFGWPKVTDTDAHAATATADAVHLSPGPLTETHVRHILSPVSLPIHSASAPLSCEGILLDLAGYVSFFEQKPISAATLDTSITPSRHYDSSSSGMAMAIAASMAGEP